MPNPTPPRPGRKKPELLGPDGQAGPELDIVPGDSVAEAEAAAQDEPGAESAAVVPQLMYDGELLQTSMTLAVLLPGDHKESYFGARVVMRTQPFEDAESISARAITVVRESVLGQIDDAIDAIAEFQQNLANSGRLPG